jgi:hypothetical protein
LKGIFRMMPFSTAYEQPLKVKLKASLCSRVETRREAKHEVTCTDLQLLQKECDSSKLHHRIAQSILSRESTYTVPTFHL